MACAKGSYQLALLQGDETWSGSSLLGSGRDWSSRYEESRCHLEDRIIAALEPLGWGAAQDHVLVAGRWRRELILWHGDKRYLWRTGEAVGA
jgi:hypothetical protein